MPGRLWALAGAAAARSPATTPRVVAARLRVMLNMLDSLPVGCVSARMTPDPPRRLVTWQDHGSGRHVSAGGLRTLALPN